VATATTDVGAPRTNASIYHPKMRRTQHSSRLALTAVALISAVALAGCTAAPSAAPALEPEDAAASDADAEGAAAAETETATAEVCRQVMLVMTSVDNASYYATTGEFTQAQLDAVTRAAGWQLRVIHGDAALAASDAAEGVQAIIDATGESGAAQYGAPFDPAAGFWGALGGLTGTCSEVGIEIGAIAMRPGG
jgi:hypothetical protein